MGTAKLRARAISIHAASPEQHKAKEQQEKRQKTKINGGEAQWNKAAEGEGTSPGLCCSVPHVPCHAWCHRARGLCVQWNAQAQGHTARGSIWSLPSTAECSPVTPVSAGVVKKG